MLCVARASPDGLLQPETLTPHLHAEPPRDVSAPLSLFPRHVAAGGSLCTCPQSCPPRCGRSPRPVPALGDPQDLPSAASPAQSIPTASRADLRSTPGASSRPGLLVVSSPRHYFDRLLIFSALPRTPALDPQRRIENRVALSCDTLRRLSLWKETQIRTTVY